jgi:hypothetical protein
MVPWRQSISRKSYASMTFYENLYLKHSSIELISSLEGMVIANLKKAINIYLKDDIKEICLSTNGEASSPPTKYNGGQYEH